jgi:hypothetical protein
MFPQSLLRPALLASLLTGVLSYAVPSKDDARRAISHGLFSPIGTDQPQPAGGNVATDAPPVNSFVAGLRPPVRPFVFLSGMKADLSASSRLIRGGRLTLLLLELGKRPWSCFQLRVKSKQNGCRTFPVRE